jgi:hypothetical protein
MWSQQWSDFDNPHIGHFSQMSFANEDEFQPEILTTLVFNGRAFPSCVVFICSFCHGTSHELSNCPYRSSQVWLFDIIFVVPPNITPLP